MMRGIIVDPALLVPSQSPESMAAFIRLKSLFTKDLLSVPIPCVSSDQFHAAKTSRTNPAAKGEVLRLMARFVATVDSGAEATVANAPDRADRVWRRGLRSSVESQCWRTPWIVVSERHASEWPTPGTVTITMDATAITRRLVFIEQASVAQDFWHDVDPWLFKCSARHRPLCSDEPEADVKAHSCLPKPPELRNANSVANILEVLSRLRAGPHSREGNMWFVPPIDSWTSADESVWRTKRVFDTKSKTTIRGIKTGPFDAWGSVWAWDPNEKHWDVQHPNEKSTGSYWNVVPSGRITKTTE